MSYFQYYNGDGFMYSTFISIAYILYPVVYDRAHIISRKASHTINCHECPIVMFFEISTLKRCRLVCRRAHDVMCVCLLEGTCLTDVMCVCL